MLLLNARQDERERHYYPIRFHPVRKISHSRPVIALAVWHGQTPCGRIWIYGALRISPYSVFSFLLGGAFGARDAFALILSHCFMLDLAS